MTAYGIYSWRDALSHIGHVLVFFSLPLFLVGLLITTWGGELRDVPFLLFVLSIVFLGLFFVSLRAKEVALGQKDMEGYEKYQLVKLITLPLAFVSLLPVVVFGVM